MHLNTRNSRHKYLLSYYILQYRISSITTNLKADRKLYSTSEIHKKVQHNINVNT